MKRHGQISESFVLCAMLAVTGGFFDAYTYLERGGVFANAQTGNIVLLGISVAKGEWEKICSYLIPICAFALGVLIAELIKSRYRNRDDINIHWRQLIILAEFVIVAAVSFLPQGEPFDLIVNVAISFVCALQVESFRKVKGSAFATTMCTGNLRSGTEQFACWWRTRDQEAKRKCLRYYAIILFFLVGAGTGCVLSALFEAKALLCCCVILLLVFLMMFVKEEEKKEIQ